MKALTTLMSLALCAFLTPSLEAAEYPTRPVRMIVPFAAGGPTDTAARTVAQAVSKSIGQPIVIENRPGADGAIAAQAVAAAPADGYTLLFATSSILALAIVNKPEPFDVVADFAPISSVGRFAFCMYVHPSVPAQSMKDFVAYARANPGKLNYASANMAENLAAAQYMKATGIDIVRVPYKGQAQAFPDLIAGRVQIYFTPISAAGLGHAKEGRIRMMATLLPQRSALAPETPTMAEAGVLGITVPSYQIIMAPAKTPREIVERLSREVNLALQDAAVRTQLENIALSVEGSTPQGLAASIQEGNRTWAQFVRDTGLAAQ